MVKVAGGGCNRRRWPNSPEIIVKPLTWRSGAVNSRLEKGCSRYKGSISLTHQGSSRTERRLTGIEKNAVGGGPFPAAGAQKRGGGKLPA